MRLLTYVTGIMSKLIRRTPTVSSPEAPSGLHEYITSVDLHFPEAVTRLKTLQGYRVGETIGEDIWGCVEQGRPAVSLSKLDSPPVSIHASQYQNPSYVSIGLLVDTTNRGTVLYYKYPEIVYNREKSDGMIGEIMRALR